MSVGIGLGIQAIGAGIGAMGANKDEQRNAARKAELDNFIARLQQYINPYRSALVKGNAPGGALRGAYAAEGAANATNMARAADFTKRAKGSRTASTNAIAPDFFTGMANANMGADIQANRTLQGIFSAEEMANMPKIRQGANNAAAYGNALGTIGQYVGNMQTRQPSGATQNTTQATNWTNTSTPTVFNTSTYGPRLY